MVEAVNGIEAVEKADHTIDLIILDVMMPGCSGVEACGEIRKKSSAPILFPVSYTHLDVYKRQAVL